jgi:hypothetical protein
MFHLKIGRLPLAVAALTVLGAFGTVPALAPAASAATTLCNSQTASVGGGTYIVQNNEWNSSAAECVSTDGGADFNVANSSINNGNGGAPGGYPSIYQGCHWGLCSSGGLTTTPIQASALSPGKVTTSWSTTQPSSGVYDVAYDIWFNRTSTTTGQPNCLELMVWLNHTGSIQPFGSQVASNVSVGGHSYNVWEGAMSTWNTVSYSMTSSATSVSNLDVGQLAADAISRGYMPSSCWLIDVEAGFELWQGGAGLATNSFSVTLNGGGGGNTVTVTNPGSQSGTVGTAASVQLHASDSAAGQTLAYSATGLPPGLSVNSATGLISGTPTTAGSYNVTVTARDGTGASGSAAFTWTIGGGGGGGACTASYSIVNSWSGGFQAQVTVKAGSSAISGWTVGWAFPGSQTISQMWNATFTQSGANVTAKNMSYNGPLAAGATTSFGFTATGSSASPSTLTCT